jgi:hypothetical protein
MNEIIVFGQGYKLQPGIKVFVNSAKRFCDKLTILGNNLSEELHAFIAESGVSFIDTQELVKRHNVNKDISPYTLKVIFFYLYCKHYSQATNVYLCDFTDVFIQNNVFELIQNEKPYVTSENFITQNCQTNSTWLNVCYNQDAYNLLKKYEVLNGGSILGNRISSLQLLKEMCADMTQIISRIGNYPNIDQASLNKVVRFDAFRYNILNNFEIFNLAHFGKSTVEITSDNKVKIDNKEPYVIHQYDVIKTLETYLYEVYAK